MHPSEGERADDLLDTVSLRYDLLTSLTEGEHEKPALVERLDSSKATVYRGVRRLEEAGLVEYGTAGYTLTVPGKALLRAYEEFRAVAGTTTEAEGMLGALPGDSDIPPAYLREAEVVTAGSPVSDRPGARVGELFSDAVRLRGLTKAHTQSEASEVFNRTVVERGVDTDIVLDTRLREHFRALDDPAIAAVFESENFTVHGATPLPFGLFIVETAGGVERAVLAVYDEDDLLRGLLINGTAAALRWAGETYDRYVQRASDAEP